MFRIFQSTFYTMILFVFSIFQKKSCWHFMDDNYVSGAICVYECLHVCVLYNLYIHINILYVL